jgi:ribosomal protein S27AE
LTGSIVGIGLLVLGVSLLPFILNWIKTVHCPKCGSWFTLEFVRFDVTDKVIGHDRTRHNGGYRTGWRGGFGGGTSHTRDNPFIREWGKARYLCKKCGLHLTIETHRDRR